MPERSRTSVGFCALDLTPPTPKERATLYQLRGNMDPNSPIPGSFPLALLVFNSRLQQKAQGNG